jgi:hypothetical protein
MATGPSQRSHVRNCCYERANTGVRIFLELSEIGGNSFVNRSAEILRHGVLLVFGAPCQLRSLSGQEHGRTIPLADIFVWRGFKSMRFW